MGHRNYGRKEQLRGSEQIGSDKLDNLTQQTSRGFKLLLLTADLLTKVRFLCRISDINGVYGERDSSSKSLMQ